MVAALIAALIPLVRCYGLPRGWQPDLGDRMAHGAAQRAAGRRRRGRMGVAPDRPRRPRRCSCRRASSASITSAQQVATLPPKLKTSFDPILGPGDRPQASRPATAPAVAKQVRQVSFWIIAAQLGIALALGIPGRAVMGLVGPAFTGGTATLGFLLAAEVIAAAAVVSEAALIYVARTRNMIISLIMLALEAGLAACLILVMRSEGLPPAFQATGPGDRRCASRSAFASITKSRLLGERARRAGVGLALGPRLGDRGRRRRSARSCTCSCRETLQLVIGVPAILVAFGAVLWTKGFGPEDRALFRMRKAEVAGAARRRGRRAGARSDRRRSSSSAQCRKCRIPVKTIASPASSAAAITSSSRIEPPGWITAVAPASAAASRPSAKGKKASDATAEPIVRGSAQPLASAASSRPDRGDARAVAPVHLAGADAGGDAVLRIDDRVRLDVLGDGPGEQAVGEFLLGRLALGHAP